MSTPSRPGFRHPLAWIPSLYFTQGIPYVAIVSLSVIMYKRMGINNTDITLYTSWLYLPWVIKPFWSPLVEVLRTKRFWIVCMQLVLGAGFAGVALMLPFEGFFRYSLLFFWLLAFSSATHDIAADGFYMLGLRQDQQAFYVGFRSTFYRLAMITGQGLIVILAGFLEKKVNIVFAWQVALGVLVAILAAMGIYHSFILPKVESEPENHPDLNKIVNDFGAVFLNFFQKKQILVVILFLLVYRLGEAQLVKMAAPFMLDERAEGGLGLSTEVVGFIYGTVGVIALVVGGLIGGIVASLKGLKYWIWWMALAINLPNSLYIFLAYFQPESLFIIAGSVAIEQLGYGFGFTAYMLFLIYTAEGKHKTAHYALGTGFMALGMMLPGMVSGWIQQQIGYEHFFIWVLVATLPGFVLIKFLKIDPEFGKKHE
ncbi:MAG: MFS transporter [Bacteroidia bacterium]|nr:MFS transporter [Bacteroidia bacterium]